jgi:hypothetical protein
MCNYYMIDAASSSQIRKQQPKHQLAYMAYPTVSAGRQTSQFGRERGQVCEMGLYTGW